MECYICGVCMAEFTGDSSLLCGGLLSYPSGSIESPNYPKFYFNNSRCLWLLAAEEEDMQQFLFNYVSFDVQECCDFVRVYSLLDDGKWTLNFSRSGVCIDGNVSCPCKDRSYFVGHRFYVTFTSDGSVAGDGFKISYSTIGR